MKDDFQEESTEEILQRLQKENNVIGILIFDDNYQLYKSTYNFQETQKIQEIFKQYATVNKNLILNQNSDQKPIYSRIQTQKHEYVIIYTNNYTICVSMKPKPTSLSKQVIEISGCLVISKDNKILKSTFSQDITNKVTFMMINVRDKILQNGLQNYSIQSNNKEIIFQFDEQDNCMITILERE